MELHFVCNLAFIFASLSVTKYIMKVCHSLFAKFVLKVVTKCLSKYHLRDFVTYYLRNIIRETLSLIICWKLWRSLWRRVSRNICHPYLWKFITKLIIFVMVICLVHYMLASSIVNNYAILKDLNIGIHLTLIVWIVVSVVAKI